MVLRLIFLWRSHPAAPLPKDESSLDFAALRHVGGSKKKHGYPYILFSGGPLLSTRLLSVAANEPRPPCNGACGHCKSNNKWTIFCHTPERKTGSGGACVRGDVCAVGAGRPAGRGALGGAGGRRGSERRQDWTSRVGANGGGDRHAPTRGTRTGVYETRIKSLATSVLPQVFYFLAHRCSIRATLELPTTTHHSPPGLQPTCRPTKFDVPNASTLWAFSGWRAESTLYFASHPETVSRVYPFSGPSAWLFTPIPMPELATSAIARVSLEAFPLPGGSPPLRG